jgi:hypothetical protein
MDINILRQALASAWCAETAKGDWTPECPSLNQCAVTALVVQDYFGGVLLRCPMTNGDSHYWNLCDNGQLEDLTARQFKTITAKPLYTRTIIRSREYVLSFPDTLKRYTLLKSRVEDHLPLPRVA